MIVKNENGQHLRRCLESVRPFISSWAVVDTGSTDGTQAVIQATLRDIPGQLIEREWVDDFAHSRNQALTLARESEADFAMVLDADDYVEIERTRQVGGRQVLKPLQRFETDLVSLAGIDEGKLIVLPTFIRLGSSDLRFHGRVHELVVHADGSMSGGVSDPSYTTRRTRDGSASEDNAAKQAYYRRLMHESVVADPSDSYAWEMLARDALTRLALEEGREYLGRSLQLLPAQDLHRQYTLRLSRISTFQPFPAYVKEVTEEVEALLQLCPGRAEAPRWLSSMLRKAGRIEPAKLFDSIADEKSVQVGAYGIDYESYRHSSTRAPVVFEDKRSSSVKYIVLPEPINVANLVWTFSNCVSHVVDHAPEFETPHSMIRAGQRILAAVDKAVDEHKPFVALRDEDYVSLKKAFEAPPKGYGSFFQNVENPATGEVIAQEQIRVVPRKFLPFIDAVENATDSPTDVPLAVE